jgi:hypothetical protein
MLEQCSFVSWSLSSFTAYLSQIPMSNVSLEKQVQGFNWKQVKAEVEIKIF